MADMQAGREFDVLIAKKIFNIDECEDLRWHYMDGSRAYEIPEYSNTWEGMQLVVEEMQRRGFDFTLNFHKKRVTQTVYEAIFGTPYVGISSSAPHAVALAAIEALKE